MDEAHVILTPLWRQMVEKGRADCFYSFQMSGKQFSHVMKHVMKHALQRVESSRELVWEMFLIFPLFNMIQTISLVNRHDSFSAAPKSRSICGSPLPRLSPTALQTIHPINSLKTELELLSKNTQNVSKFNTTVVNDYTVKMVTTILSNLLNL